MEITNFSTENDSDYSISEEQANNPEIVNQDEKLPSPILGDKKISQGFNKNNREIDGFFEKEIIQEWSIAKRLSSGSMYKEIQKAKSQLFQESTKYRLAFYSQVLDTRLSILNEQCSAGVKTIKADCRTQIAAFIMEKMKQLKNDVKNTQFSFIELISEKHDFANKLSKVSSLYKRFMKSIIDEEEHHFTFLDNLMENFATIIDEEITK